MTTASSNGITMLLRALAVLQGAAIVVLVVLLNGADGPPPVSASPAAAQPTAPDAQPVRDAAPPAPGPSAAPPAEQATPADTANAAIARDAVGTVLYGRVLDEAGQPVTAGWVSFTNPANNKQVAQVALSAREPCYAVAGLAAGDVAYRSRVTGYKEASGTIPIPPGTPQLRHDIVLTKSWELAVRILTPEGEPLRAAFQAMAKERPNLFRVEVGAVATPVRPERDFPLTALREITAGIGRWRSSSGMEARSRGEKQLPNDVAGVLELDGKQPVWVSAVLRHRVLASVLVEPGQPEVTLTVSVDRVLQDLCTIRGRIVDAATKEPVTSGRVGFGDRQSSGGGAPVDAEGRFEARDLRPGLLTIEVQAGRRTPSHNLVAVRPGEVLDLGDVLIAETRTYPGRLEGLTGKADACRITVVSLEPPPHASLRAREGHARVEADGTFQLYVMDGRYRLRAYGAGGAVMDIDTRTLGEAPLVVQLGKESSLRVDVQTHGEPFELAMFDGHGREVYRRDLQHGWKLALPFLPGDYRVELKDGRGKVDTRRITLGDAGADLRVP